MYVHLARAFLDFFGRQTPEGDVDETCVALAGLRRSLIFPYLRVWELGTLVVKDVRDILSAGKRCILRCLLQVRCDCISIFFTNRHVEGARC